jgi:hypothetical protein
MLNNKEDANVGDTVFLTPRSKQAPRICYGRYAVTVTSLADWPYVTVQLNGAAHNIHRDNINKSASKVGKTRSDGDGVGGGSDHSEPQTLPPGVTRTFPTHEEPPLF